MSKGKILVVEPDENIRNMLDIYFTGQGYEIACVADGASALKAVQDRDLPDIMLMELELSDMDGYALLEELFTIRRTSPISIIILQKRTERTERRDNIVDLELGADNYITKPFDLIEVQLRIENTIEATRKAKDFSPISNRPKSHLIVDHLNKIEQDSREWVYLNISVKIFEAFSEIYGWQAGDEVIRTMSLLLGDIIDEVGTPDDFVGHPQRDNFVLITHVDNIAFLKQKLIENFHTEIKQHYSFVDRERGYMRDGDERVPLMSLMIRDIPQSYFGEQWNGKLPPKQA